MTQLINPKVFRAQLKRLQKERGITNRDLAKRCGLSESYMSYIRSGERGVTYETVQLLAAVLDVNEKALAIFTGEYCVVQGDILVLPYVTIGHHVVLDAGDSSISIAEGTRISSGAKLFAGHRRLCGAEFAEGPITIGRDCWIKPNAVVYPGTALPDDTCYPT